MHNERIGLWLDYCTVVMVYWFGNVLVGKTGLICSARTPQSINDCSVGVRLRSR